MDTVTYITLQSKTSSHTVTHNLNYKCIKKHHKIELNNSK